MPKALIAKFLLLVIIGAGLGGVARNMISPEKVPEILFRQSNWSLLTLEEQKILRPLAEKWDVIDSTQQEKWRAIAKKYPSLSLREQQKIQRRMTRWAKVEPKQQDAARKKFKTFKKKKAEEQERLRSAWKAHQDAKEQSNMASISSGSESSASDGPLVSEEKPPFPYDSPSSDLANEGLRTDSQE